MPSLTQNKTFVMKAVPEGWPKAGSDIVVEDRPIDLTTPPPAGAILGQVLVSSYDPYQRPMMRDSSKTKSYAPGYPVDGAIKNAAVVRVVSSSNPKFAKGDLVRVPFADQAEYAVVIQPILERQDTFKIDASDKVDPAEYLGVLGMPGLTAYAGLYEIGKPKKGETIFVSSAAGAVGALVGQLAKREGLRVVGSVGSDAKVDFVTKELGFDAAFNYKTESPFDALPRLCPDGIDIYWENVGGDHLEAALQSMNLHGRIPVCGLISAYNADPRDKGAVGAIKNPFLLISSRITITGFLVDDLRPKYFQEHRDFVLKGLADGSIKSKLSVTEGIDNAVEGFLGMLKGENHGKAVLKIAN